MSALQIWLQNHNRKMTQNAIDEALMEYITHVEKERDDWQDEVLGSRVSVETLTAERDALKQQRDYLVTALEWALGNINCEPYEWTCEEDSDAHRSAIKAIASINEK